jgi:hypothetical protein
MEEDYSKRELDMKFKNSDEKNDAWSATILQKIEETHKERTAALEDMRKHEIAPLTVQVTKTNGTVTFLTKMVYMALGALLLLVPWAGWVTTEVLTREVQLDRDDVVQIIYEETEDY